MPPLGHAAHVASQLQVFEVLRCKKTTRPAGDALRSVVLNIRPQLLTAYDVYDAHLWDRGWGSGMTGSLDLPCRVSKA